MGGGPRKRKSAEERPPTLQFWSLVAKILEPELRRIEKQRARLLRERAK